MNHRAKTSRTQRAIGWFTFAATCGAGWVIGLALRRAFDFLTNLSG